MIFNLPHIFIVFPPGAGGNFISNILKKIVDRKYDNLTLSDSGNSHLDSTDKLAYDDSMTCGIRYCLPTKFDSFDEKLKFYKAEIEAKHGNDTDIKVTWTHDFTNIQLYKKLFPNCKILVVSVDTNKEKLAALIQQEFKNSLDPAGFVFMKNPTVFIKPWLNAVRHILISLLGNANLGIIDDIINNYHDARFSPIMKYVAITKTIKFYDMHHLIDSTRKMKFDYLAHCVMPNFSSKNTNTPALLCIGPSFKECITDDCVIMPYSVLMENNLQEFILIIENILDINLDNEQLKWIQFNFEAYYNKQPVLLMKDPKEFFKVLSRDANEQIASLLIKH